MQVDRHFEFPAGTSIIELMQTLKPHDHLCLIYETYEEWKNAVVPYILAGIERGDKCLYIVDDSTAQEIRALLREADLDVEKVERTGQFAVLSKTETYTRDGYFDPEAMIRLLIEATEEALSQGYPALRVTGEMSWALKGYVGSEKLLEYEAMLNRDIFPHYPCTAICQYNRFEFEAEIIKGVILTHPLLIWGSRIYRNFYYIEPEDFLEGRLSEKEVEHWLGNLEEDRQFHETRRRQEEQLQKEKDFFLSFISRRIWASSDLKTTLGEITEAGAELIRSERTSIWWYNDDCSVISCYDLYERSKNRHSAGEMLHSKDFPFYTASHREGEIIAVTDVFTDPRTGDIPAEYFNKHNIKSLMDTPIWLHDRICGLLSFEHVGEKRSWSQSDQRLASSMAALVSLCVETVERKRAEKDTRESEEKYRKLAESTDAIPWEFDIPSDRWTYVAPQVERILGYAPEEWTDLKFWADRIHPDDRRWATEYCEECTSRGEDHVFEYRFIKKDGTIAWLHDDVSLELDGDKPVKLRGFMIDITERKKAEEKLRDFSRELEQKVEERTAQLEAANREMEAFTYSVSHDLRAPLRAVDGFTRIILEDYGDKLDQEGRRLLQVIYDNTRQMDQLITDLLVLSRATRKEIGRVEVDMAGLVHSAFTEAASPEVRDKIELNVNHIPHATGDPNLLKQVWHNLLSNAIKFTMANDERYIEVSGYRNGARNVYYVKDNGAGFDPRYSHKMFGVFQRLHGVKEFSGTGIGLAIVQRIIHRHGGETWAEGEINRGATIYFSLPAGCPEEVQGE